MSSVQVYARITGGKNPLDATSVHPESYDAAKKVLEKLGYTPEDITGGKLSGISKQIKNYKKLAEELGVGETDTSRYCKRAGKTGTRST